MSYGCVVPEPEPKTIVCGPGSGTKLHHMVLFSINVKEVKITIGDDVLLCSWFCVLNCILLNLRGRVQGSRGYNVLCVSNLRFLT